MIRNYLNNILILVIFFSFAITSPAYAVAPAPVIQTGQTSCWNEVGALSDCNSTGQDGDLQHGVVWPAVRFHDNGNGTMTDDLTGLIWLKNADCFGVMEWGPAVSTPRSMASGQCGLNDGSVAGQWRLPSKNELESLINLQQYDQAGWLKLQGFSNVQNNIYWSSTTNATNVNTAWFLNMFDTAFTNFAFKTYYYGSHSYYVWPVRSPTQLEASRVTVLAPVPATGQSQIFAYGDDGHLRPGVSWPEQRFTDNNDQTMTDTLTGLVWSKDSPYAPGPESCGFTGNWQRTLEYVQCLNNNAWLGYTDWRIPNLKELLSLVNLGETPPSSWLWHQGFTNMNLVGGDYFWTSDTCVKFPNTAWTVGLSLGTADIYDKTYPQRLLPVRGSGGPSASLTVSKLGNGSGTITSSPAGISCDSSCSAKFALGQPLNIHATPGIGSMFLGWTGCDSTSNIICSITMYEDKNVAANFKAAPMAKIDTSEFSSLQLAYDDQTTNSDSVIKLLEGDHAAGFTAGRDITVTLEGGYNAYYSTSGGETTIPSPLLLKFGTTIVKQLSIR